MRQINDMPPQPEIHVFEHREHSCPSPNCGKIAKAPFLGDVARPGRAGTEKRIEACLSCVDQLVPPARFADILADLFNAWISQAALLAMIRRTAGKFRDQRARFGKRSRSRPEASGQDGPAGRRQAPLGHAIFDALPFVLRVYPSRGAVPRRLPQNRGRDHFAPHFSRLKKVAMHAMLDARHLWEATAAFEPDGHLWAGELIRFLNRAERDRHRPQAGPRAAADATSGEVRLVVRATRR